MYQKILLTHDGSDVTAAAIPHAITVANAAGAEVVVCQVIDSVAQIMSLMAPTTIEPLPAGGVTAEIAEESVAGQRAAAQQNLDAVKAALEAGGVSRVSTLVVEGRAGEAICTVAAELGCDLVVMATHGRSGISRVLLGSVAEHVVRHVKDGAVLLVHPQKHD